MRVFFCADDYRTYIHLAALQASRHALKIWAYCLMPNHAHLIVVPATRDGLSRPLGEAHRRFAELPNRRKGWTGHLWQARFDSFPMEERHLLAAVRYVLLNPVRAGLVKTATAWPYSSARAQVLGRPDKLVDVRPVARRVADWERFLAPRRQSEEELETIRRHSRVGRPLGSESFIDALEEETGRDLRPSRAGRKKKE